MVRKQDPRKKLEQQYCPRLDRLYTSAVKCPYCKNKIQKLQTTCSKCGLNKIQIAYASNKKAKQMMKAGERGKIVMMRRKPTDVKMWQMAWRLIFGIFGVHNFYVGRKIRGWVMLGFMVAFIVTAIGVPLALGIEIQELGEAAQPIAFLSTPPLVMWIADAFGIVFGWYKYPVRLGEDADASKVRPKKKKV